MKHKSCHWDPGQKKIVIDGNKRKYANLARNLRFYGGIISATEVGCNLRCKFCFSDAPVKRPKTTGSFYTPKQVFDALSSASSPKLISTRRGLKVNEITKRRKGATVNQENTDV